MAFRRELRMNDKNKKCGIALVVSFVTLIILQYSSSFIPSDTKSRENLDWNQDIKARIKEQIKEKAESMINSARAIDDFFHEDDGCETDQSLENKNNVMEEYLVNRKHCLLKYCGDVCINDVFSCIGISYID